ncbi:MAG: ABC transporter ATP-binding protein [Victivallales bacterium]|nr:ABC transporter ATP-binding protein [Victivallales bacterium]
MKIEVKELVRHFGKTKAVDNISFEFEKGNIFGFVGPNGAGKTTTIKIMSTLDMPDSGDVLFDNVSAVDNPEQVRRLIGYMPDALPEHKDIKVWEYLDFFARAYGVKGALRTKTLKHIEEFTNLGGIREKTLNALSKGMKQRVSLARALVHDPQVLIMDEPAAGLDPRARRELRDLLRILADQGKAILISSHILTELQDICHGTVIVERGKVLQAGRIDELSKHNERVETTVMVRFFGDEPQDKLLARMIQAPFVEDAKSSGGSRIIARVKGADKECSELLSSLIASGCRVAEYKQQEVGLEELFMKITKGDVQ